MAITKSSPLDAGVEQHMRDFSSTLSEKARRRFAAIEARQFGRGGITYVADVLGCSRRTIRRGLDELDHLKVIRLRAGFGDQGLVEKKKPDSEVAQNLLSLLETRTAGDPDDEQIIFTDLSPAALSAELCEMGTPVSDTTMREWLPSIGFSL